MLTMQIAQEKENRKRLRSQTPEEGPDPTPNSAPYIIDGITIDDPEILALVRRKIEEKKNKKAKTIHQGGVSDGPQREIQASVSISSSSKSSGGSKPSLEEQKTSKNKLSLTGRKEIPPIASKNKLSLSGRKEIPPIASSSSLRKQKAGPAANVQKDEVMKRITPSEFLVLLCF
jgi:hypothetical protein